MKPSKVVLDWRREQYEDGVCTASDSFTIDNAALSARNGACYVSYVEGTSDGAFDEAADGAAGSDEGIRTTLRISPDELTLIRHGAVQWNHTFKLAQKTSSTMYVGGAVLAIETVTKSLAVNLTECSGDVHLVYDMDLSGMTQTVKLWIRFGEHDGENTKKTKHS